MADDPFTLFDAWFAEATGSEPNDPNAFAIATCGADLQPQVRMVLMKDHGPAGFTFYTHVDSAKGLALADNPNAAMLFHWKSLRRQIRIEGAVGRVDDATADAYFASRPRGSQLGAWASKQSRPLASRATFLVEIADQEVRFGTGAVPRPGHWTGFRLTPARFEFWQDQPDRLHERRTFASDGAGGWVQALLYP